MNDYNRSRYGWNRPMFMVDLKEWEHVTKENRELKKEVQVLREQLNGCGINDNE